MNRLLTSGPVAGATMLMVAALLLFVFPSVLGWGLLLVAVALIGSYAIIIACAFTAAAVTNIVIYWPLWIGLLVWYVQT